MYNIAAENFSINYTVYFYSNGTPFLSVEIEVQFLIIHAAIRLTNIIIGQQQYNLIMATPPAATSCTLCTSRR